MTADASQPNMKVMSTDEGTVAQAMKHAAAAADSAGVQIRLLLELPELEGVYDLIDRIWKPDKSNPLVTTEQLRALSKAGNYIAGAFLDGRIVAACVGFFAAPVGEALHSHIAGVAPDAAGRSVGFALKLHQRAWALQHGLSEVTWTFDPLVRRNAYFNLAKLAARPRNYFVNFYGDISDAINGGQGSDRLLMAWDLGASRVAEASAGRRWEPALDASAGACAALTLSPSGGPVVAPEPDRAAAPTLLVQVPPDIEAMRRKDASLALEWRLALREVLGTVIGDDARVTGFSRSGAYVVERKS